MSKMSKEQVLKHYNNYTENNEHTMAISVVCNYFGYTKEVEKLKEIMKLEVLYGYVPTQLRELRNKIWEQVKEQFYSEIKGMTTYKADYVTVNSIKEQDDITVYEIKLSDENLFAVTDTELIQLHDLLGQVIEKELHGVL